MPTVFFGTKDDPGFELELSEELIAVRTRSKRSVARSVGPVPSPLSAELDDGVLLAEYPDAGVEVYRVPVSPEGRTLAERKEALRASPDVRFAGGGSRGPENRGAGPLHGEHLHQISGYGGPG